MHPETTTPNLSTSEPNPYYQAAAAYVARGIEAEAIRTSDDVPSILTACADSLPHVLPEVAARFRLDQSFVPPLLPLLDEWLRAAARLHQARAIACEPLQEMYDTLLDAIRWGANPAAVGEWVLQLLDDSPAGGAQ